MLDSEGPTVEKAISPSDRLARRIDDVLKEYRAAEAANAKSVSDRIADAAKVLGDVGVSFSVRTPPRYISIRHE